MTPFVQAIRDSEPDLEFMPLASGSHQIRGFAFEFYVCRLRGSGQYRIYVAKDGEKCGYIYDPAHDVRTEVGSTAEAAIIQDLLETARRDVEKNFHGMY